MLISSLPDANPLPPEHKIEVFVLFWPPEPTFSGISSTKSAFLCQNWQFSPGFCPFRAQNRGFCALLGLGLLVFGRFEHIICIFVLGVAPAALSQMTLVQFYRWGDAAAEALNRWDDNRWAKAAADVGALGKFGHKKEDDRAVTLSEISERYCNPFYSSYSSLLRRSC